MRGAGSVEVALLLINAGASLDRPRAGDDDDEDSGFGSDSESDVDSDDDDVNLEDSDADPADPDDLEDSDADPPLALPPPRSRARPVGEVDTPLMVAASLPERDGGLDLVRLLVRKGADIFAVDTKGSTAAHRAAMSGNVGVLAFLRGEYHAGSPCGLFTPPHLQKYAP